MTSSPTAAGTSFALDRIGQIAIVVKDSARATAFYRDVLGMRLLFEAPPRLAFFDCGGVRLMLSPAEGPEAATGILYYAVADIAAALDTLQARGVQFEQAPHLVGSTGDRDVWIAFLRDSEGNLVGLISEVPRKSSGQTG